MTPEPYYADDLVTLHAGDCVEVLRADPLGYDYRLDYGPAVFADCSVDAVITDPPYGLGFMGKEWDSPGGTVGDFPMRRFDALDAVNAGASRQGGRQRAGEGYAKRQARDARAYGAWCEQWAAECLRVLKPGGHLLAFGGTRTYHRIACAVEDAGFEIRDSISWLYGSGFPKSLDVSKAIDKAAGHWRGKAGEVASGNGSMSGANYERTGKGDPVTAAAAAAAGWGTALKPAHEPIVVGRKSLVGTVAQNVLAHGTGALNIDACRIATGDKLSGGRLSGSVDFSHEGWHRPWMDDPEHVVRVAAAAKERTAVAEDLGRWPTNVVLDESQAAALDEQTGVRPAGGKVTGKQTSRTGDTGIYGAYGAVENNPYNDVGGASRFFPTFRYEAKAGSDERPTHDGILHPTVKPLDLMRWLVRLVTPPGGICLEPFAGSGTTAEACVIEGFRCIAIEREPDYLPLIVARLSKPIQPDIFGASA